MIMPKPTLLVIEDMADQAVLVGIAARRAHPGLDVRTVTDGGEGIAYLAGEEPFADRKEHPLPDLVILDLYMPEVDGFEVLEWLESQDNPLQIPVAVLTSSPSEDDEARALQLGATAVHRKPPVVSELAEVVREIVHEWIGRGEIIATHLDQMG